MVSRGPRTNGRRMPGQAMTELLICATFLLIPLFLIVPMFGKYIDMHHATIQAARYEAWEYTVWYEQAGDRDTGFSVFSHASPVTKPMGGFDAFGVTQPIKSLADTQAESRQRFFSRTNALTPAEPAEEIQGALPISDTDKRGWTDTARNFSWQDGRGAPLYNGPGAAALSSSALTPLTLFGLDIGLDDTIGFIMDILGFVSGIFADLFSLIGSDVGTDFINQDGYATATVGITTPLPRYMMARNPADPTLWGPTPNTLSFRSHAAVLTDGWNAGGWYQTYNQAGGVVPSVFLKELLDVPGLDEVWAIIGYIAPELRECDRSHPLIIPAGGGPDHGSLWLGHLDIDAVHPDRLGDGEGSQVCDDAGRCDFEFPDDYDPGDPDDPPRDWTQDDRQKFMDLHPCIP